MNSDSNLGRVDVLWQQAFKILTGLGQQRDKRDILYA
jgi:hypothetical protein